MRRVVTPIKLLGLGVHPTNVIGEVADRVFHSFGGLKDIRMSVGQGQSPLEAANNAIDLVKMLADDEETEVETDLTELSRVHHLEPTEYWYLFIAIMIRPARNRASP